MGYSFYFDWEVQLILWLQSHLPSWMIGLFSVVAAFGEEFTMVAVLGICYWSINKETGKDIGYNVILIGNLFPMIKNIALRRRPYVDHSAIQIFRPVDPDADIMDLSAQGFSFPSGHSANTAGIYGSIAQHFQKKWVRILCIVIPVLVGCSRFILGAHYPTDVLCGWALGLLVVFLLPLLRRKLANDRLFRLVIFLAALPGVFYCRSTDYFTALGMLIGFYAAIWFEEKRVHFQPPQKPLYFILRPVIGALLFYALNVLLKLPFSDAFLVSATPGAFAFRVLRYAIIIFIEMGVYPMIFRFEK